jgi:hypothetical protein
MEIFGDLERLLAELYPYRIPLTLAALLLIAGATWIAWRRGWVDAAAGVIGRHRIASAVAAVAILAVTIPMGYYLLSPLWTRVTLIEESPVVTMASAAPATPATGMSNGGGDSQTAAMADEAPFQVQIVLEGEWIGADAFHFAEGRALVIETEPGRFIFRVEDFSIRNGPDLFVYLSSADGYTSDALKLGGLRATDGAFNYEIPDGVTLDELRSAVVWCDRFAVLFATAALTPPPDM